MFFAKWHVIWINWKENDRVHTKMTSKIKKKSNKIEKKNNIEREKVVYTHLMIVPS